ncbi:MAG: PDZ domain-containing protein [Bacteroidales bacterium]|nr:PDZ domain-containing protein [Bacteroidales bacterium]
MKYFRILSAVMTIGCVVAACDDDEEYTVSHNTSMQGTQVVAGIDTTLEANRFVYDVMSTFYYWNKEMPDIDYRTQKNTEEYFYSLLSTKDRFSYVSDDAKAEHDAFAGKSTTYGYTMRPVRLDGDNVGGVVFHVDANSPAERAGFKRGDIITSVDGVGINISNYYELLYQKDRADFTVVRYESADKTNTIQMQMAKEEMTICPVAKVDVVTSPLGRKVGYILYNGFDTGFDNEMAAAFSKLKNEGVQDLIVDLRYNPGGDMDCFVKLCSHIAPSKDVSAGKEILYYEYNELLSSDIEYSRGNSNEHFDSKISVNLDLSRVYFLTSSNTYSASEATILALSAYMDVVLVGDKTGGKNSTMFVLTPDLFKERGQRMYPTAIDNWMVVPITSVYKNVLGKTFDTSEGRGIDADYYVNEMAYLDGSLGVLGTESDPLTAKALECIDGTANKSLSAPQTSAVALPAADVKPLSVVRLKVDVAE